MPALLLVCLMAFVALGLAFAFAEWAAMHWVYSEQQRRENLSKAERFATLDRRQQ